MLLEINNYIEELDINIDSIEELDILFNKLCDRYSFDSLNNINSIKFILLDRFGYNPLNRNNKIKSLCEERDGQNKFREKLILRDKHCLITMDNFEICEACHIIPYSENKTFKISNGLLLNRCFHKMFDKYMFSINEFDCLIFSPTILINKNYNLFNILYQIYQFLLVLKFD